MNAYCCDSLKIYEVLGYMNTPEMLIPVMGEQMALVRFNDEKGTPILVRTDEIVIK